MPELEPVGHFHVVCFVRLPVQTVIRKQKNVFGFLLALGSLLVSFVTLHSLPSSAGVGGWIPLWGVPSAHFQSVAYERKDGLCIVRYTCMPIKMWKYF